MPSERVTALCAEADACLYRAYNGGLSANKFVAAIQRGHLKRKSVVLTVRAFAASFKEAGIKETLRTIVN